MGNTYAILGLRRKRAHLAGEIEAAEQQIAKQRASLANLDAVILLFDASGDPALIPSIRPKTRGLGAPALLRAAGAAFDLYSNRLYIYHMTEFV